MTLQSLLRKAGRHVIQLPHMWSSHRETFEMNSQCSPHYFIFQSNQNMWAWKCTEKLFQQSGMKIWC